MASSEVVKHQFNISQIPVEYQSLVNWISVMGQLDISHLSDEHQPLSAAYQSWVSWISVIGQLNISHGSVEFQSLVSWTSVMGQLNI